MRRDIGTGPALHFTRRNGFLRDNGRVDYAGLDDITWDEARGLLHGDVDDQIEGLLRCGFHAVMPGLTTDACRERIGPGAPMELRRAAILSLAHLTRTTATAPPSDVLELVREAGGDPELSGTVSDFFDDLVMFAPPTA